MNLFRSYKSRKILVLSVIVLSVVILILLSLLIKTFFDRIVYEQEWLKSNLSKELTGLSDAQVQAIIEKRSTSIQLRTIFLSLISTAISAIALVLILSIVSIYGLLSNLFNGSKLLQISTYFALIAFVMLFFLVALQPTELTISTTIQLQGPDGSLINVNDITASNKINYTSAWICLFASFTVMIIIIVSRLKYGFLTKDIILNKKFKALKNEQH
ncbi:hypothetical protein [Mycoplasmopsis columboralis]|uniref:Uncharacterized protein n=1 Tax=Mycoplasmopsis columboralis TaxID=171282 RepID=A0A449B6L4_9BACT|nr:hypothetical protein [Mycoplasmopsis columboralis]VEU76251.1 Uncharacterised protein [Mycoplasmopsis columboralis]